MLSDTDYARVKVRFMTRNHFGYSIQLSYSSQNGTSGYKTTHNSITEFCLCLLSYKIMNSPNSVFVKFKLLR